MVDGEHAWPLDLGLAFHHLGVACERIEAETPAWAALGYAPESEPFVDPAQGIRGLFLTGGGPRVELLEPHGESSTLAPWLKRHIKIYHTGYIVGGSFDSAYVRMQTMGATVTRAPALSVYFKTRIAFLMLPNLWVVELIETA